MELTGNLKKDVENIRKQLDHILYKAVAITEPKLGENNSSDFDALINNALDDGKVIAVDEEGIAGRVKHDYLISSKRFHNLVRYRTLNKVLDEEYHDAKYLVVPFNTTLSYKGYHTRDLNWTYNELKRDTEVKLLKVKFK